MADRLVVRGAREHNLKDVSLDLPRDAMIVFTGLSGSGKSSLAFDTIFAEGQRRYVESLSAYARQFLGQMDKPDVDFIDGLSPAVSIDQKSASTLANFTYILFQHETAGQSVVNSFTYAAAAAFIAIILGLSIAYIVSRRLLPYAGVLSFVAMAPFVVPGIVLAIAFYAAYAPPPFALYGTATILILAFATRFLPIGYANADAAIRAINPEMEEAVRILGGGRMLAIRKVMAPLMKRSLVGAWLLVFIPATRELSTAMFLYGPKTRTMSVMLMDMSEEGNFEHLAALGFLLLVATLVIVGIASALLGRDFMLRRERQ